MLSNSSYFGKKDKYFSDNINYLSSIRENKDYRNKLIYNINDNKVQNSNMNKIHHNKNQYITYEPLNDSEKDQDVKSYNSIRKSIIKEEKNNDAILIPYNKNNNNYIHYNYMNSTLNNTNKSKINSYKYISTKNNTFETNLKYNFNSLDEIYLNKNNSIKINDNDGDEDNIEFSKSTNNFNTQYAFSSKNLNNNRNSNNIISNNNNSNNILNYYIVRKNEFLNSNKEFNSSINQNENPRQQNYIKTQNSNEIEPKQNMKTIYYDNFNNSINKSKEKSTRNNLYHYYAYDFDNNRANKIEEYKNYYDNLINDDEDNEKTKLNFNNTKVNANSYTNLNREHLYKSIDRKENDYMNDVRIFKNKNYNNFIEDNKNKEIANNQNINGINFNNINIGINNNNFILDNNLNNGYKTYYGSFMSKPIKVNVNTSNNFRDNDIIEIKDEDSLLKDISDISKSKKKYLNKRNKSQNSKLIVKTEEDQNINLEKSKTRSIYNKIKINKNLLYNNTKDDEEKSNYGVLSYNFHRNKDELFNNYFLPKKDLNDKYNYNNMNNDNSFLKATPEKKNSDNIIKNNDYFIFNDEINNLNEDMDLKDENDKSNHNLNSIINNKKSYNNNQIYESKYNNSITDKIMHKNNEIKNKDSYKNKLENIKSRVTNLLDVYQVLLNDKIIIIKKEM